MYISAPGETDDQMYIWLEDERALASGDNYYPCFPNLYALRGSQYRNIGKWIESLRLILKLRPEILLPGHAKAITGYSQIEKEIGAYADSIEYILNETLKGINEGKTADELALIITLPEELKNNLSFGEHYGCTEWTVRSICDGYLGWFDGNPTSIHRLSPAERGKEMVKMAGGAEKLLKNAKDSLETGRYLWGMELCDHLINADILRNEAIEIKIECCMRLAEMETSANGRHFYQMYAKEFKAYRNS